MNGLESLKKYLEGKFPEAQCAIETPANEKGFWHLDVLLNGNVVSVTWKESHGFGITHNPVPFSGPDEIKTDLASASERVTELLS